MKVLHLICNAHIDPVWQWGWDEGISSALSTYKSACDLADEFDYIFVHNESMLYEMIEKVDHNLFERIKKLIKENKWCIGGGWYLQPDCNMPSGETFIRLIGKGKKYFKEKFNVEPKIAYNFDSFGHSLGLVQILKKSGYKGYLICRPNTSQFKYPGKFFNWVGPDGSSVIVSISPSYTSLLGEATKKIIAEYSGSSMGMLGNSPDSKSNIEQIDEVNYVLWGVGNHGGGPSRKDLTDIGNLHLENTKIVHSTPEMLFNDNILVSGEVKSSLVTSMPGCYSSMALIKQTFRRVENLFFSTEKMLSLAALAGVEIDEKKFYEAEKYLFLPTFHDILPGTSISEGEQEGLASLYAAERIIKDYRTQIFLTLSSKQPVAQDEFPIFVFNYSGKKYNTVVETEFTLANQNWDMSIMYVPHVYKDGIEIPSQCIKENSTLNLDWRKRVAFEANLDPLSISRYSIKVECVKRVPKFSNPVESSNMIQETLYLYDDTADPWGMSEKEQIAMGSNPKEFKQMNKEKIKDFLAIPIDIPYERIIESGNVYNKYEKFLEINNTRAVIQKTMYKNHPFYDLKVIVEFNEKNKLVRLKLPIPNKYFGGYVVGDGPYIIDKKPSQENVYQKWFGKVKDDSAFSIINDCVYAGCSDENNLYITLLRGSGYCFHPINSEQLYPYDRYLPRIDCGRYEFNFRIMEGSIFEITNEALNFNSKPYCVNVFPTGGKQIELPKISINGDVLLYAIKKEDKKYIFRLHNPRLKETNFSISINGLMTSSIAGPNEIITIVFENGKLNAIKDYIPY